MSDSAATGLFYSLGTCGTHFLAAASFGPHPEPWQPGALFGSATSFLLSVLELALHWVKHCSNLRPAAALQQSRGGRRKKAIHILVSFFGILSGVSFWFSFGAFCHPISLSFCFVSWLGVLSLLLIPVVKMSFLSTIQIHTLKIYSNTAALFGLLN